MIQWLSRFPIRIKLAQLAWSYKNQDDNWKYIKTKYSPYYLGSKCEKDFSSYFKGDLTVEAETVDKAINWLVTCDYEENNNEWKHPTELEKSKKGDCKDYCLWLWRRLLENGSDALFIAGERERDGKLYEHAWVLLKDNEEQYILDPLSTFEDKMLDIESYKEKYIPWLAASDTFEYYLYGGYIRNNV